MEHFAAHWGTVDEDLLWDPERYATYALAHHVTGHAWALCVLGLPLRSVGLGDLVVVTDRAQRGHRVGIEAVSILTEALSLEAAVSAANDEGFGAEYEIDRHTLADHIGAVREDSVKRGCLDNAGVIALLTNSEWLARTQAHLLASWWGIHALANALGHGAVLEADEAARTLGW